MFVPVKILDRGVRVRVVLHFDEPETPAAPVSRSISTDAERTRPKGSNNP